jgi:dTDP-4-amino-4,6-dideoxygalactose transaminase
MGQGVYQINDVFEEALAKYTGAPYVITVDNMSNALYMCLMYVKEKTVVTIPNRTYPSVPCEIIRAGHKVAFETLPTKMLKGAYQLKPLNIWDSALRFTHNMYLKGQHMCVSFTGPYKHLKLGKGGCVLTDSHHAMLWFKRFRFSGRRECSYHTDFFDTLGINAYLMPELAARGLLLMNQFYDMEGNPKHNEDLELPYPDLSQFPIYTSERFQ